MAPTPLASVVGVPPPADLPVIQLRGLPLHALKQEQCVAYIHAALDRGRGGWVVTPNLDFMRRLDHDQAFFRLCGRADLIVADGMPLVWASRLQGTPLPQRVAGSDLILSLSREAGRRHRSVYLLGGAEGTAQRAARVLRDRCPGLVLAGCACPTMLRGDDPEPLTRVIQDLERARPDIVFVALGSPKQEHLIDALHHLLPTTWWVGVGISFSFLCGEVRRAPRWMQRGGLEWVHRLGQEPGRLARRYLVQGLPFALVLLAGALWARWHRPGGAVV